MFIFLHPLVFPVTAWILFFLYSLRRLYGTKDGTSKGNITLSYSPNEMTRTDLVALVIGAAGKYLPYVGAQPLTALKNGFEIPHMSLTGFLEISEKDVALFNRAVRPNEAVPEAGGTSQNKNLMFLVPITTPLFILIMVHPSSPISPLGAVNTRNRFIFHDPSFCASTDAILQASVAGELTYRARIGGADALGRRKRRGMEFEVIIEVFHNDAIVLTQELSFLQFMSKTMKPLYREAAKVVTGKDSETQSRHTRTDEASFLQQTVTIPKRGPQMWAACCKDYNPIHFSSLVAKAFGFRSIIAHGNYVVAKIIQNTIDKREVNTNQPSEPINELAALYSGESDGRQLVVEASFTRPVVPLPATLDISWEAASDTGTLQFSAKNQKEEKDCIVGKVVLGDNIS